MKDNGGEGGWSNMDEGRVRVFLDTIILFVMIVWIAWSGPLLWKCWESWKEWQLKQEGAAYMMTLVGSQYPSGFEVRPLLTPLDPIPPDDVVGFPKQPTETEQTEEK